MPAQLSLRHCVFAFFFLVLIAPPLYAHNTPQQSRDCAEAETLKWRGGTIRLENDLFTGTDQNYTNGVALIAISRDIENPLLVECLPLPIRLYTQWIEWVDPQFFAASRATDSAQNLAIRAGQSMFTPEDKTRSDLIIDDRPYAGLLYFSLAWNKRTQPSNSRFETLDVRELTLGVIGPLSQAEQAQNFVHRVRGIERFNGWDHQLSNEPAFQMAKERKLKPYHPGAIRSGWSHDAITSYALRVGNIETSASAGLELRAGWNIPNDFGSYPIRPGSENRPPSRDTRQFKSNATTHNFSRVGTHVFLNMEAKAVAWDFSLDGNLFRGSHHVTRRPLIAQLAAGISSQWLIAGHGLRVAVMRVWRTREFDEQPEPHAFGSIAVSLEL